MTAMTLPAKPWTNGMLTADQRYQYDSTVGAEGAWRANPVPAGGLPAGSIIQWASNTIPANWLLCDGSAVSRTVYPSLFAAIGTQYGSGDGSTTFNLPDLRGRVAVGKNGGTFGTLGATGGAETVTLTANNLPAHNHPVSDPGHTHPIIYWDGGAFGMTAGSGGVYRTGSWAGSANADLSAASRTTGVTVGNNTTTNTAVNNLQPYQVTNYIIKATIGVTAGDSQLATRVGVLEQNPSITGTLTVAGTTTHNGRVLAPNQPAFFGARNNYGGQAVGTPWIMNSVAINVGNHYNSSTGLFTCPVAGNYEASLFGIGGVSQGEIHIRRNGNDVSLAHWNHDGATWDNVGAFAIISCAANDTISFSITGAGSSGLYAGGYNAASIKLLG